ncbi:MAG: hypothetical protein EOO07_21950 [Chitinophagaceae bacterium]|nr:MAG: hypothetical protein EOO07_21950 [Chitinophagaceae bacterium]
MDKRADAKLDLRFLNNYVLEDEIYSRLNKLQALCAAQIVLDTHDISAVRYVRAHYSMVIDEQVTELRNLLNQLFN